MGIRDFFTKGSSSSYDQTFTLFDLFRGRGGRTSPDAQDQHGFVFTEVAGQTNSGETVSVDNLLDEATTMTCINAITQGVTQIPIYIRKKTDMGDYEVMKDHPVAKLFKRPNDYQTATEFKSSIVTSMLTNGNAFIYLVRAGGTSGDRQAFKHGTGRVLQMYPMEPSEVKIGSNVLGRPSYSHDEYGNIPIQNIVHIRDLQTYTPQGLSRALLMSEIIGIKKAADALVAETFRSGANLNYVVSTDVPLDAAKLKNVQEQMKAAFGRRGNRRGGAFFIEQGSVESIKGLTPADVDLREIREQAAREIAAGFRVPAFMAGIDENQTYNNVRQYWTAFHRDTLQPIVTNIEEAFSLKLLTGDEELFFDIQEILSGDIEITNRVANDSVSNGIRTQNEARQYVGLPRLEDPRPEGEREGLSPYDILISPNSTVNTNVEETPENSTGGEDGPQGRETVEGQGGRTDDR